AGETWHFSATRTALAGDHDNVARLLGHDSNIASSTVSASDDACYFGDSPAVQIVKKANGHDSDCVNVPTGSTVTYTYDVTATGSNVPIAIDSIIDDNATLGIPGDDFSPAPVLAGGFNSGDTNQNGLLEAGETWHFSATRTALAGDHDNVARLLGHDSNIASSTVSASDDACYFGDSPSINI